MCRCLNWLLACFRSLRNVFTSQFVICIMSKIDEIKVYIGSTYSRKRGHVCVNGNSTLSPFVEILLFTVPQLVLVTIFVFRTKKFHSLHHLNPWFVKRKYKSKSTVSNDNTNSSNTLNNGKELSHSWLGTRNYWCRN